MNTIKHTEYKHNGSRVILDTCELAPGKYETMLLYPNGHEIACRTARTESGRNRRLFDELLTAYPADTKPAAPKPLTGKYAKLRDDLREVVARSAKPQPHKLSDGGTCNLDAPSLLLPRWQSAKD